MRSVLLRGGLCLLLVSASSALADESLPEFVFGGEIIEASPAAIAPPVTRLEVRKSERRLILYSGEEPVAEYEVALGSTPTGPKQRQGDGRTPEGRYTIDWRKPNSDFHRALHISYPNAQDLRRARERGHDPGGSIMIHGLPNGMGVIGTAHTLADWTDGCIAVTNYEIEEIWEWVPDGAPIDIFP